MEPFTLVPGTLQLNELRRIYQRPGRWTLAPETIETIQASNGTIRRLLAEERAIYGINTGYGLLAQQRVSDADLQQLQRNLILSHATGTGKLLDDDVVRLVMALKINSLARGYSGVRLELIEQLLALYNAEVYPCIPEKGSVGASGDLAPLAHLACGLMGIGQLRSEGQVLPAEQELARLGLSPLTLHPKEGLALINGTQASTGLAIAGLLRCEDLFCSAMAIGALTVDAAKGSDTPFDPRIHEVRGHQSQIDCARVYRELLAESEIRASHLDCQRVQDPYSLRCQPQVMGACLQQIRFVAQQLSVEANAVSDNPLVFSQQDAILSGGNFHAEPVAMACDALALAIAEIGAMSERRIALLIDHHFSELPPFLVQEGGLNSGFMNAQVTAAALASENKSLAHPACVDSLPTSANQEDHVSMATFAARRLHEMADNTQAILAIELLAACQGIDFRHPLKTSSPLSDIHHVVRARIPSYDQDRFFAPDIQQAVGLIPSETLIQWARPLVPSTQQ